MDNLPDQLVCHILCRIENPIDRKSVSLSCKFLHKLDNEQRKYLRIGCGLNPANEALTSLCNRFSNLTNVEINYSGWMSKLGKQLDDQGLLILSRCCASLVHLTLSYCTFISDSGLSLLASCSNLSSLKLEFTPRITACGILIIVVGCKRLRVLHLIHCLNLSNVEWLEHLGKLEMIEDLLIKNCRLIKEGDLGKLGPSWQKMKRLQFEVGPNYRLNVYVPLAGGQWIKQTIPWENMVELSLVNCIMSPGRGLSCILGQFPNLEKVRIETCVGVQDRDIISLVKKSNKLRSFSLGVPIDFRRNFLFINNPLRLTDKCLQAVADNCSMLETIRISFSDDKDSPFYTFALNTILSIIQNCPIRELALDHVYSFNGIGMEALCSAQYLESLELTKCQEMTDDGMQFVQRFPQISVLKLKRCLGVTDDGLKALVGTSKLELLDVEDCPQISEIGAQGAAKPAEKEISVLADEKINRGIDLKRWNPFLYLDCYKQNPDGAWIMTAIHREIKDTKW